MRDFCYFEYLLAEGVGFEPTVRLRAQRFSSSLTLVPDCVVECDLGRIGLGFAVAMSHPILRKAHSYCLVRLQFGLQSNAQETGRHSAPPMYPWPEK